MKETIFLETKKLEGNGHPGGHSCQSFFNFKKWKNKKILRISFRDDEEIREDKDE